MTADPDSMIETCLVCKVAWDTSYDPPACSAPAHPHALNRYGDWDKVCHGRVE